MSASVQGAAKGSDAGIARWDLGEELWGVGEALSFEQRMGDVQRMETTSPFAVTVMLLMFIVSWEGVESGRP